MAECSSVDKVDTAGTNTPLEAENRFVQVWI